MSHVVKYGRSRFPVKPGKGLCRGCHQPVGNGRKTWCSNDCFERYEPERVKWHCFERDKGVCAMCGIDTKKIRARAKSPYHMPGVNPERYRIGWEYDYSKIKRAYETRGRHRVAWCRAAEKRLNRLYKEGWPGVNRRHWWDMDHIIPYSEGGLTILENVRTLCCPCHKKRTAEWRRNRNKK